MGTFLQIPKGRHSFEAPSREKVQDAKRVFWCGGEHLPHKESVLVPWLTMFSIFFHLQKIMMLFASLPLEEGHAYVQEIFIKDGELIIKDMMKEKMHYHRSKVHA